MAAPEGNKNAEKWTEETTIEKLNELLDAADFTTYIGEGLSEIGLYGQWFSEMGIKFKDSEIVSETIKAIEQKYEAKLVSKTLKGDYNPTMAIFTLKNKHSWKDKTEQEITGKDGKDLFSGMSDEDLDKAISRYGGK